ncbi:MAG: double-strand break repair protein AddB [Alphaproteobacteria bacterium]|nr:double-strand break repair protein AddB [Alphaproteobacteria bacterium]
MTAQNPQISGKTTSEKTTSGTGTPRVFSIPGHLPFADTLAATLMGDGIPGILEPQGKEADPARLSHLTLLLPTRRACRALQESFLRQGGGRPVLLPRMAPLGDLDEEDMAFAEAEDLTDGEFSGDSLSELPPAISETRRRLLLTRLVRDFEERRDGSPRSVDQAALLAGELARLLNQTQRERLSFDALAALVPDTYADHWRITLDFLKIVTEHWPRILEEEGRIDPVARRNGVLERQAGLWRTTPPDAPVIAAGSTGSLPATADLLQVVADLPQGAVVLPGLDGDMDEESWQALAPSHPQYGMARLLARLGVERDGVQEWPCGESGENGGVAQRTEFIREVMRPAQTTPAWQNASPAPEALCGIRRVDCPSPREEAGVIALLLREALETPGKRAALVTPDRDLARRVAAELERWHVRIDDSAGQPLAATPPGVFLRLSSEMMSGGVEPLPLLAVLKHPLAAGGGTVGEFRAMTRRFEKTVLRGPRPAAGFAGLAKACKAAQVEKDLADWFAGLEKMAKPFSRLMARPSAPLKDLAAAHLGFAEALAADHTEAGAIRLWRGEAGEAAAAFFAQLLEAAEDFPVMEPAAYAPLLRTLMGGAVVRPRYGRHPRLHIWGLLEARLQQADLVVLGGLNEGGWPQETAADSWMSRPMREAFGLPPAEVHMGLSAHDFAQAFAAPEVVMTRSTRVAGTPTVPSRWLLRIEALLPGDKQIAGAQEYLHWYGDLDAPQTVCPVATPEPRPPVAARPRKLSVTAIETWLRDPYAVYARRILELEPLPPLDADPGAAERGKFIHDALDAFVKRFPKELPANAEEELLTIGEKAFGKALERPGVRALWWPRFTRIAHWFLAMERQRRADGVFPLVTEAAGQITFSGPQGPFVLTARADRIDRLESGGIAVIDYKTGGVPSPKQVKTGLSPQLPLEAAIAAAGGFEGMNEETAEALVYFRLTGRTPPGEEKPIKANTTELVAATREGLEALIAAFDDENMPYLSRLRPMFLSHEGDYDHLARVREWSADVETDE